MAITLPKTHLEKVIDECLRPVLSAMVLLRTEIAETMQIPHAPWQILNKPYDELSEGELVALFDIYHVQGEVDPCPMCNWTTRVELQKARKEKETFGG
ncbi:hypothetical protein LCGC14_2151360 [marine sediment metagenome]|uniref:Uncharacterized protein n=1 Tax=marine sediment metagenome TaxID=412755 RepID=A0A0F9DVL7_9ZZZZ